MANGSLKVCERFICRLEFFVNSAWGDSLHCEIRLKPSDVRLGVHCQTVFREVLPELLQTARCSSGALSTIYLSTKSFQTAQPNPFITTINRSPPGVLLVLKSHQKVLSHSAVHAHAHVHVHFHVRGHVWVKNHHPNVLIHHIKM